MGKRSYGDGTVHLRAGDGRWVGSLEAGITERGTRRRVYVYGKTEAEAAKKLTRKRGEIERAAGNSTAPDAGRKTVHAWGAQWLAMRVDQVRPKTYESDETAVRKFIDPTIGRKRIIDLAATDVRAVETKVRQHGGEDYVRKIRAKLMLMLRDAITDGYSVPSNLFEASKTRGHTQRKRGNSREALEIPQAVAVLGAAAQADDYARWVTGFYQGQRQGQTLGLTWDDGVDMDRGLITLSWQLQPLPYRIRFDTTSGFRVPREYEARRLVGRFHLVRPKTDAAWRVTPMTDALHEALTTWRAAWPENPHGLIWARGNGWPIDKAHDADRFRELQVAAGVRKGQLINDKGELVDEHYTGHEMRNTCATILVTAGVDPATITAILGHSSWSMSLSYATAHLGHMRAALAGVSAAYRPEDPKQLI